MSTQPKPAACNRSMSTRRTDGNICSPAKSLRTDAEAQIFLRVSSDDGVSWSEPVRVDEGIAAPFGLSRGNDARIAAHGDRLVAVWTTAGEDEWGTGPMATALSSDGGKTWQAGPNPADDGLRTGHAFIDVSADAKGAFHLVWLDHRSGKQGLYHARSDDGGAHWAPNDTIDAETCQCCWNVVTTSTQGDVLALYRDVDPRDMALASSRDGGKRWERQTSPAVFDWQINGCPHVGGALVTADKKLHAIVGTGKGDAAGLYYVSSPNEGQEWSRPKRLGGNDARHGDLALSGRSIASAWDTPGAKGAAISAAVSGGDDPQFVPAKIASDTSANHPRVLPTRDGFRVFWTENSETRKSFGAVPCSAHLPPFRTRR